MMPLVQYRLRGQVTHTAGCSGIFTVIARVKILHGHEHVKLGYISREEIRKTSIRGIADGFSLVRFLAFRYGTPYRSIMCHRHRLAVIRGPCIEHASVRDGKNTGVDRRPGMEIAYFLQRGIVPLDHRIVLRYCMPRADKAGEGNQCEGGYTSRN